ncbi:MAG TPA: NADP-dependent oxidoreductase [Acidimicrobiales bacterium]|nr:NADP-dependent oxidoreductase [Acidimicrobiales bacterium]
MSSDATKAENRRMILAARPQGMVDASTVRLETGPVPEPGPGQALVKVQWLSIDPTIRTWMDDRPGYLPPIALGEVVRGAVLGQVTASNSDAYAPGDMVVGMAGWQDWTLAGEGAHGMQVIPPGLEPGAVLNVFGVNGLTAYWGMLDVGRVQSGDIVVVSGAAGATGSLVGQIAKIKGAAKVVGLAGTPEKCAWITDELGFDAAIDYRTEDVAKALRRHCPQGIDLYFDNVGGEILDICLAQLALRGRIVLCGAISAYNATERPAGPSNVFNLIIKRGRMEGFLVLDYMDRAATAQLELAGWMAEGKIKHREHVVQGLEHAPDALNVLFTGENIGKVIVEV